MNYKVVVTLQTAMQSVPVSDVPAGFLFQLDGQANQFVTVPLPSYSATFEVSEGKYNGSVQAVRADSSAIGSAIPFTVDAATPAQALAPAAQGVTVEVTPVSA